MSTETRQEERARDAWETLREKRKQLYEASYGGGENTTANAIVSHARRTAEAMGLSGEDYYVLMASSLLEHANKMEKIVVREAMLLPHASFFMKEPS